MQAHALGEMETRFADIIWHNAPVKSGELVKLCAEEFGWKRTTTFTMLRRLCDRGLFENQNGTVVALMTRREFDGLQSEKFIEKTFGGSLPQFLAAFTSRKKLSDAEIAELEQLIKETKE